MAHTITLDNTKDVILAAQRVKSAASSLISLRTIIDHETGICKLILDGSVIELYPNGNKPREVVEAEAEMLRQLDIVVKSAIDNDEYAGS